MEGRRSTATFRSHPRRAATDSTRYAVGDTPIWAAKRLAEPSRLPVPRRLRSLIRSIGQVGRLQQRLRARKPLIEQPPERGGTGRQQPVAGGTFRAVTRARRARSSTAGAVRLASVAATMVVVSEADRYHRRCTLRTVYELEEEGIVPSRARIAERLHQSGSDRQPSASAPGWSATARSTVEGAHRHLELTDAGRMQAGPGDAEAPARGAAGGGRASAWQWEDVHAEACRWEHAHERRRRAAAAGDPEAP